MEYHAEMILTALIAAGLGALRGLEPGHGRVMAAGARGRVRQAVGAGLMAAAVDAGGMFLLGTLALFAAKYMLPERVYPGLNVFWGLAIVAMAGYLMLRAWMGLEDVGHGEGAGHRHWYAGRDAGRGRDRAEVPGGIAAGWARAAATDGPRTISALRGLLGPGMWDWMRSRVIPCPAGLAVLMCAVSMRRAGLGLLLIGLFSLGGAAGQVWAALRSVRARGPVSDGWRGASRWGRWLPLLSPVGMFVAGAAIALAALPASGLSWEAFRVSGDRVPSFLAIVGLGLFLGMRHSTDPDHVVAVTTIVSRERSVRTGAVIGMMWGLGHTLTIFMVGAAIILFKLTIPPRLGLSMELAVAGMLILLGVLNLSGALPRITHRLTPAGWAREGAAAPAGQGWLVRFGYYQLLRPLAVGLVHGLAGSAAVALLVLSMIRSPLWAVGYLVIFGLGTVLGMMLMTTAIAVPVALSGRKVSQYLTVVSGLVSVCFGIFLVYHIGFVDGLFTSHVHWTPE